MSVNLKMYISNMHIYDLTDTNFDSQELQFHEAGHDTKPPDRKPPVTNTAALLRRAEFRERTCVSPRRETMFTTRSK